MNSIILIGRVTRDIEAKTLTSGSKVCNFALAVDRRTKDGKTTDFIDCAAWGKTAEVLETYIKKGNRLAVMGSLQTRTYQDKDGNDRKATEVLVERIDFIDSNNTQASEPAQQAQPAQQVPAKKVELPFEI